MGARVPAPTQTGPQGNVFAIPGGGFFLSLLGRPVHLRNPRACLQPHGSVGVRARGIPLFSDRSGDTFSASPGQLLMGLLPADPLYCLGKRAGTSAADRWDSRRTIPRWPKQPSFPGVGTWNLSSPTMDRTWSPCIGRPSLNHWTIREVPSIQLYIFKLSFIHGHGITFSISFGEDEIRSLEEGPDSDVNWCDPSR
ncbi:uncharacterized protein ACBT57_021147 [Dama dama]